MKKIAITTENEQVFQHFGMTKFFTIYEVEDGKVISKKLYDASHSGHEALAYLLRDEGVSTLICGGIGGGAKQALQMAGVELVAGVQGNVDEVIAGYLSGKIQHDPSVHCDHHGHHHQEAAHVPFQCGSGEAQKVYGTIKK